ncbi:MAG: hypothetical protein ACP5T0_11240 [Verrucomicrobiia bacterium]
MNSSAKKMDGVLAKVCQICPLCRQARKQQSGIAFKIVSIVEIKLCPFCRAYERVYGKKAHEGAQSNFLGKG